MSGILLFAYFPALWRQTGSWDHHALCVRVSQFERFSRLTHFQETWYERRAIRDHHTSRTDNSLLIIN